MSEERCDDLKFFADCTNIRKDRYAALSKVMISKNAFVINGWIAEKDIDALNEMLMNFDYVNIEFEEPKSDDNPPVLMQMNGMVAPMDKLIGISKLFITGKQHEFEAFAMNTKYFKIEEDQ